MSHGQMFKRAAAKEDACISLPLRYNGKQQQAASSQRSSNSLR